MLITHARQMKINATALLLLILISFSCEFVHAATTLRSPANGSIQYTLTPTLTWDAISGATRYRLVVSENSTFSGLSDDGSDTTSCINSSCQTVRTDLTSYQLGTDIKLSAGKIYYWKVRDTASVSWSSVFNFTVIDKLSKPTLSNPARNSLNVLATAQNFQWNSVQYASKYRILVVEYDHLGDMTSNGMNSSCKNSTTCFTDITSSTNYAGFNLKEGTKYYWLVWAGSSTGIPDSDFGADYFTTGTTSVGNKLPVLVSGSASPDSIISGGQVTFQAIWDDPEKKSVVDVQVRFRKQGTTEWRTENLNNSSGYTFSGLYEVSGTAGTYEYQFKASDADTPSGTRTNTTDWLAGGIFKVEDAGPPSFGAPKLISPENGATNISYESATFTWEAVTNATNYRIVISKDSSFSGFDDSKKECDPKICQTVAKSDTSYTYKADVNVFKLEPETTYYWRVRANSSTLNLTSDWSQSRSFTTAKEQIALNVTISGAGTVTSNPAGIDCGTVCSASYGKGTVVALTAVAAENYIFRGWNGACSGKEQCYVTMDSAKNVTAIFTDKNTRAFKIWLDKNNDNIYQAGEELKGTDVRYRVVNDGDNPADIPLAETTTDGYGAIYLSVIEKDTIYIEKEYKKEDVIEWRSTKIENNPYAISEIDNVRYELVIASDIMEKNTGEYLNFPGKGKFDDYKDLKGNILVELSHPKWQWNLSICFEEPHTEEYYEKVKSKLYNYANYLYNYTNGYSMIKNLIFIKGVHEYSDTWRACDINVKSEAQLRANATPSGYMYESIFDKIEMNKWLYEQFDNNIMSYNNWAATLGHESGHYLFGLRDEYISCAGQESREWIYRETHNGDVIKGPDGEPVIGKDGEPEREPNEFPSNYGVMDGHEYHELSDSSDYFPVDTANSEYINRITKHYCSNQQETTWETFQRKISEIIPSYAEIIKNLVVPTNIGKTYPLPVGVESDKRLGPKRILNNKLNIIEWSLEADEKQMVSANVQVCKSVSKDNVCDPLKEKKRDENGNVETYKGKDIEQGVLIKLITSEKNGDEYILKRETIQGRTFIGGEYTGILPTPITSFINDKNIKQTLSIHYTEDNGLSKIKYYNVDLNDIKNKQIRIVVTSDMLSEVLGNEQYVSFPRKSLSPMKSYAVQRVAQKQGWPEGGIINITPINEQKIQLTFLAKDVFLDKEYAGRAVLRQHNLERNINLSFQDNGYVGTSESMYDKGIADIGFQTEAGIMRADNQFEIFNTESNYSPGFPSPDGELQLITLESSFEGSGKFVITSSSITPPTNNNLNKVGNVWSFGFADSIKAIRNVSFNILINGRTNGLDATKLHLYGWDKEKQEWQLVSGGSNDLKEFNINLDVLAYDSYALFAPVSKDTEAPEAATGFQAQTSSSLWGVDLKWIAPKDNRDVYVYDIRFNTVPITEDNWNNSISIGYWATPKPGKPGSMERTFVNMPDPATEYYFAIRSADAAANWSDLTALTSPVKSRTPGETPSEAIHCDTTVPDNFSRIQDAVNHVAANAFGGTVCVQPGTYTEAKLTLKDGVYLAAMSSDPAQTILDGDGKDDVISFQGVRVGGVLGFTLRNSKKNGNAAAVNIAGDKQMPLIARNIISGNRHGIRLQGNVMPLLLNNTIADNSGDGITAGGNSPATILNNIVVRNQDGGIVSRGKAIDKLARNDVYGNKGGDYVGIAAGEGGISLDPRFSNGLRLAADSPCIGTGLTLDGKTVDMGAYGSSTAALLNKTAAAIFADADQDSIDDNWELLFFGNLTTADSRSDYDRDGYSDLQEYLNNRNRHLDPKGISFDLSAANAPGGEGYGGAEQATVNSLGGAMYLLFNNQQERHEPRRENK